MNREWTVRVVLATGDDISDAAFDEIADRAEEYDATVARRADAPGVAVTVDLALSDPLIAAAWGRDWARELVGAGTEVVDVRVCDPDIYEAEAFRPDTPELLSASDVANELGVSRQRVYQLQTGHPTFPAPYARLGTGPIWTRPVIEHFAQTWVRKSGRPAKAG